MAEVARLSSPPSLGTNEDSKAPLPPKGTRHWVPRQKAAVVVAVRDGALSLPEACERYMLTEEEFYSWMDAVDQHGIAGLSRRMRTDRRKTPRQAISEPGHEHPCFVASKRQSTSVHRQLFYHPNSD